MGPRPRSKIKANYFMATTQVQVLLAVRDTAISASVAQVLMQASATVSMMHVRSTEDLLERLTDEVPSLLVLELDRDWRVLEQIRKIILDLPVIVILTRPTEEMTFAISRLGAEDIWMMPLDAALLAERAEAIVGRLRSISVAHRARTSAPDVARPDDLPVAFPTVAATVSSGDVNPSPVRTTGTLAEDRTLEAGVKGPPSPPFMMGLNPKMAEIRDTIEKVSGTDVTVLIRGESGVGKEVVARLLFEHSRRRQKPFIKVNCAAIPHDLLESELFGYEAGAFTGAVRSKPGKFELADHGTLFLDEIAEMHPSLQAKLLHVLQDGKFSRLGAKRDVSVNVRVLCATNKLLEERVRERLFREDLLYRINVVTISLPPLRERRDEIPILTEHLLEKYSAQYGRTLGPLSAEVMERMMEYDWPGNIRELENLCKRFVLVGSETQILRELSSHYGGRLADVPRLVPFESEQKSEALSKDTAASYPGPLSSEPGPSLLEVGRRAAWEAERRAILQMLEVTRWNRREASRRLQVSYKALLNKIKQMELEEKTATAAGLDRPGKTFR